jgi:hypothetical protein
MTARWILRIGPTVRLIRSLSNLRSVGEAYLCQSSGRSQPNSHEPATRPGADIGSRDRKRGRTRIMVKTEDIESGIRTGESGEHYIVRMHLEPMPGGPP